MRSYIPVFLVLLLINLVLNSCDKTQKEDPSTPLSQKINTNLYGDQHFIFPEFSKIAKIEVSHWGAYEDFDTEVKLLNGHTIEAMKIKTSQLVLHLDSLCKKIPEPLNTQAIFSRVLVVKTRTSLLDQALNKTRIDSIELQLYIDEMNISVKNLIIQINEKFEKDQIDLIKNNN